VTQRGGGGEGDFSMLKLLGVVFYLLAGGVFIAGLLQLGEFGGSISFMLALASAISMAFFGAMCFVADDVRALVARIADKVAPQAEAEEGSRAGAAATPCDWCGRQVADPYKPCSSLDAEKLRSVAPQIQAQRCREEIAKRLGSEA
jgi:hypothetical protein